MIRRLMSSLLLTASLAVSAGPVARWVARTHDFGAFAEDDGPVTTSFTLVNDGDAPLVILSGRATCGCTKPDYPTHSIAPGDSAAVSVTYDPQGRPGHFAKHIYIETNTEPSRSRLDITGTVIGSGATVGRRYPMEMGPMRLSQRALMIGEIFKDHTKTVYTDGYNLSADSLSVRILRKPEWLDITVRPETVPPGEQVTFIAYANSAKSSLYGLAEDSILISPAPGLEYTLPVTMLVKEEFKPLKPGEARKAPVAVTSVDALDLGAISRSGAPVTASFELTNSGGSTLHIRRAYSSDPGVTVSCSSGSVKKGKSATVTVTADPSAARGDMLNARVSVITDDPVRPTAVIRLTALLKD